MRDQARRRMHVLAGNLFSRSTVKLSKLTLLAACERNRANERP
jgi:hypothetical protein